MSEPTTSPAARVRVRIGRLVLDGFSLTPRERLQLRAALSAELSRLLTECGVSSALAAGGAYPHLRSSAAINASAGAAMLGAEIARAVYREIGG